MKFISEGKDGEMIMTAQETKQAMKECITKLNESDPNFLYVPGRVIHMFDLWSKTDYGEAEKQVEQEADEPIVDSDTSHCQRLQSKCTTAMEHRMF